MKPSFALLFHQDSVGLLHRLEAGWTSVGSVRFDDPDLMDSLGALRGEAQDLMPDGVSSLLILPASEILYLTLPLPEGDSDAQRDAVIAALEGRTPYAIDELAFDWHADAGVIRVAAVARETLAEAETFAQDFRFNPLAFTAAPEADQFPRAPWFGLTLEAGDLPEEEQPRPETTRIVILPDAPAADLPVEMAEAAEDAAPEAPTAPPAEAAERVAEATEEAMSPPQEEEAAEADTAEDIGPRRPEVLNMLVRHAEQSAGDGAAAASAPLTDEATGTAAPEAGDAPEILIPDPAFFSGVASVLEPPPEEDLWHPGQQASSPATRLLSELASRNRAPAAPSLPVAAEADLPQAAAEPLIDSPPEPMDVGSAPAPDDAPVVVPPEPQPTMAARLAARLAAAAAAEAEAEAAQAPALAAQGTKAPDLLQPDSPLSISEAIAADSDDPERLTEAWPGEQEDLLAETKAALAASLAAQSGALPPPVVAPSAPPTPPVAAPAVAAADKSAGGLRGQKLPAPERGKGQKPAPALPPSRSRPAIRPAASEAEAMTVYGKRQSPVRGKPRYLGLALTGALLAFLVAVAVWAAIYLEAPADRGALSEPEISTALTEPVATDTDSATTLAEAGAQPADVGDAAEPPATEPAITSAEAADESAPATAPAPVAELSEDPAPAADQQAGEGITPGTADSLPAERLALPATDQPPAAPAAPAPVQQAAVTGTGNPDLPPAPAGALPAFDALYQFDGEGRILATSEGVITPDGVHLIAAHPHLVPPARPAVPAPAAPEAAAAETTTPPAAPLETAAAAAAAASLAASLATDAPEDQSAAEGAFAPDNRLNGFRPRLRPAIAAPADQGELIPDAPTRRPAARSAAARARGAALAEAESAQTLVAAAAAAASAASLVTTDPALAATPRPAVRPSALASIAPASAAAPSPRRAVSNPQDDEDDGEPEVARSAASAPRIPTQASVARQATMTRAINLSTLNLIGVFGTTAQRYALVRETGGRVVRIKVGDRLDGGRVTAITGDSLSYQKGGSTRRLQIPRG